jgi:hypothetical protein
MHPTTLPLQPGMVDHAELIAVRITHHNKVGAVWVGPLFYARRSKANKSLDVARLLARVEVQVHPHGLLWLRVRPLEGDRQSLPIWVDEHHKIRIPLRLPLLVAQRSSPKTNSALHVLDVDHDRGYMQVSDDVMHFSHDGKRSGAQNHA